MKSNPRTFLTIGLLVWQLGVSGLAQASFAQQPSPTPTSEPQQPAPAGEDEVVRISTNLVQVDPVVTDKNGKQVTDLRPDEVQIFEDGKPQKITNFSYIALEAARNPEPKAAPKDLAPIPPTRLRPEQVRRTIALVVDDLGLSFESTYHVRQALKKFLDQQMQPDDLVAIIRTGGGIGALQQFTSDKRQLYAAVEKIRWNANGRASVSAFAPISNDSVSGAQQDEERNPSEELDQFREELFAVGTLGAVNYVVRGLRELPGRKSVLLISDGIKIFNRSDPTRSDRILNSLRRLTDLANRASVVIYTMDARGLATLGLSAADSVSGLDAGQLEQRLSNRRADFFESQNGLNYLAQQTGGLAIRNRNDLNGGIRQVIEDQAGYYLIGYRPDESTFDVSGRRKFHRLSLKVLRPGKFNVRLRNGFFGVTDEDAKPAPRTAGQQLVAALTSPFGSAGVHVRLTSLFANDPKFGSMLRSMLHVRGSDLTFTTEADGWHKAVFEILAVTFGDNGTVVDQVGRTHTIRAKGKVYERIMKDGFTYNLTLPVKKAGAYQLRAALRDVDSSRVGSASQFVEVPDLKKNRLTLSGVVLNGLPLQAYQKEFKAAAVNTNDDTVDDSDPKARPAVRQFATGLVLTYGYFIYNAQIDKSTGKPRLQTQVRLFRNGQQVFAGKELPFDASEQGDLKRIAAAGAIQLGTQLEPGEYVFQVIVTDLLAKEKYRVVSQWLDFEIIK